MRFTRAMLTLLWAGPSWLPGFDSKFCIQNFTMHGSRVDWRASPLFAGYDRASVYYPYLMQVLIWLRKRKARRIIPCRIILEKELVGIKTSLGYSMAETFDAEKPGETRSVGGGMSLARPRIFTSI